MFIAAGGWCLCQCTSIISVLLLCMKSNYIFLDWHVASTGTVEVVSELWPMQFSGRVTLLTWECMQNNALPWSVAAQVATKVLARMSLTRGQSRPPCE